MHRHAKTVAICLALAGATASLAWSQPAAAQVSEIRGGPIESVAIVRQPLSNQTNSTVFVDVPGIETVVKAKENTLIVAHVSAESICNGQAQTSCIVRVVAVKQNGRELELLPKRDGDATFDMAGDPDRSARSVERSILVGNAGKYTVKLQYRVNLGTTFFSLAFVSFRIETARGKR